MYENDYVGNTANHRRKTVARGIVRNVFAFTIYTNPFHDKMKPSKQNKD
jgi:hypothetical protein